MQTKLVIYIYSKVYEIIEKKMCTKNKTFPSVDITYKITSKECETVQNVHVTILLFYTKMCIYSFYISLSKIYRSVSFY